MAKLNIRTPFLPLKTHEGAPAARITPKALLRRSVASCFLWEKEFYEDGIEIGKRIFELALAAPPAEVASLAVEARNEFNLRHVPLVLLTALAQSSRRSGLLSATMPLVLRRADELAEFLVVYAALNGVTPDKLKPKLSAQVRKGLAKAFGQFNAYALAKYNRDGAVKLRDVLFLCHAKPRDSEQAAVWKQLIDGTLPSPDTWEVALSSGADKRETWTRLLAEGQLGYFALLRNLRNMAEAKVDPALAEAAILARKGGAEKILPFRFIAAAKAAPQFEGALDRSMLAGLASGPQFAGMTAILVDVSGSMDARLSSRSDLTRADAAAALAAIWPGRARVFSFSSGVVEVPPRKGMAGVDAILRSQPHASTRLGHALEQVVTSTGHEITRLVVITDEQSADAVRLDLGQFPHKYLINVASARNGVGYGQGWVHLDGFSESVLRFMAEHERESAD